MKSKSWTGVVWFIAPLQDEVSGLSLGGETEEKAAESGIVCVKSWSEPMSYLSDN